MISKKYMLRPDEKVSLAKFPTRDSAAFDKKLCKQELMPANIELMQEYQKKLYAENKQALLIVFQAMDAAGKDGTIRHVMSGLNPQGTQVVSFKQPSAIELDHDYLWRIAKNVPARGNIGIFNRSHYEEVIITRVHDLLKQQQIPLDLIDAEVWQKRYRQIRDFEQYLFENGIHVLKFFLHLSKEEQAERLLSRILEKEKNWKFSSADIAEREHWDSYQEAYEQMLMNTSTDYAPWYLIPADQKWYSRYLVSEVIKNKLIQMDPKYPQLGEAELARLEEARLKLEADLAIYAEEKNKA
ncbi:MAG: polyphosphate kinase 2 family protein [Eubacteriales bacterium]|nr:polyphosphate kinase 2 family protein [Eubacteriales bacterium]